MSAVLSARKPGSTRVVDHPSVLPLLSGLLVMVGFLPWIHSGLATYASFSVARMGRNLGVAGPFGVLCGAWAVVPLLAALVVMARVLGRDRLAGALALVLGLLAMTGALAVVFGATAAGVELSPAPIGAAGLGALVSFLAVTELRSAS